MEIPKLKKEVGDFLLAEDGRVTKSALIRLGVLSAGALVATTPTAIAQTDVQCDVPCKNVLEAGGKDTQMTVRVDVAEISDCDMDMMDGCNPFNDAVMDKLNAFDVTGPVSTDVRDPTKWDAGKETNHYMRFKDLHRHANSLSLEVKDTGLVGTHSHSIAHDVCSNAEIHLRMKCYGDASYTKGFCWETDETGTKKLGDETGKLKS